MKSPLTITAILSLGLLCGGAAEAVPAACLDVPNPVSYSAAAVPDDAASRHDQAALCLHYEAYRLAPGPGDDEAIALGAMGACLNIIHLAQDSAIRDRAAPGAGDRVFSDMRLIAQFRVAEARVLGCGK